MRTMITTCTLLAGGLLCAQGPLSLTLQQAMDLAAQQSYAVQASQLEAEKARSKVNEVLAYGLPQVDANGSFSNYLEVPTSVIKNFTGEGPDQLEIQFGVPWNAQGTVQLNQLIFDGSYIVGLNASREYRTRSEEELQKTQADARAQAARSYLGVLAAREGARLAGESVPVLEKSHNEAAAMRDQGFMEETDVDRLSIALAEARDRVRSYEQQERVALAFLRLVLGVPAETPLTLTDALDAIVKDPAEAALTTLSLDLNTHIEHQLASTVVRIQQLDLKNQRSAYLPKLYGFINAQAQTYGFERPLETDWFPSSMWGVQLQVPIFSSGMRSNRVKQADLQLKQTEVNLAATEQRLIAEAEERAQKARTAELSYTTNTQNLELARRIFDRTSIKFTNGLSSSFELNQDQGQYLQAQQVYLATLVDLLVARIELRRALDLY